MSDTHLSDHSIIVCVLKSGVFQKTPVRIPECRSYRKCNKKKFCSDLKEVPWNEVDNIECDDKASKHWESLFKKVADRQASITKQRVKCFKAPWLTNEVVQLRRKRNCHQTKAHKNRFQYHWQMYTKLRNHINRLQKRLKFEYFCRMIEDNTNGSSRRIWTCFRDALRKSKPILCPLLNLERNTFPNQLKLLRYLTNIL